MSIKTEIENLDFNRGSESGQTSVVFRGDGEPLSPDVLLRQLGAVEAEIGLEPDS